MKRFNNWLALQITKNVGTMACAYLFTILGAAGIYYSLSGNTKGALVVGSVSGYFLQLVLLPIIIVGQNLQSSKHDELNAKVKLMHKHIKEVHKKVHE